MFRIRKTKTSSGSTSIQVVYYKNRKVVVSKHIGSSKKEEEISRLISSGQSWIEKQTGQLGLFEKEKQKDGIENQLEFIGVSYVYAYEILEKLATRCGMKLNKERFLFDFSIMRLIEASSKLRAIKLLDRYFEIKYSERTVYRKILELVKKKESIESIESIAIKCAKEMLREELRLVLYDVTTLYFESFKSDELRIEVFSKDNKPQQPQIVIGLITTRQGYPLSYEVFYGNTFKRKTMLEVLDNFIKKHKVNRPIFVADAAMLIRENIEELKERKFSYIVGARLANSSRKIIEEASKKLQNKDGKSLRLKTTNGDLIIEFSQKRYRKDKHEMKKQIEKAKLVVE